MKKVVWVAAAMLAAGSAFATNITLSESAVAVPTAAPAAEVVEPWTRCAVEGGICTVPGPTQVRYGANNQFAVRDATDKIACGNQIFGDPVWGLQKACSFRPIATAQEQWIECAQEGAACIVPESTQVRYGASGKFAYKDVADEIPCANSIFGDPVWGIKKSCAYRPLVPAAASAASASVELPAIPSNFDVNALLVPSWGSGVIPASGKPDVVGAFRFICMPGQVLADDPIVYPGQPGQSHLHQFFGNTAANAQSTYKSLRTTGDSTCNNMLNRSAYWIPAMMNGRGKAIRPDYVSIYYKRRPASDPECMRMAEKGCRELPRGLRYIFGYNMNSGQGGGFYYNCDGPTATAGHYPDIVAAAKACPTGNRLGVVISAPECWDGKTLDASDHRSHMAYTSYGSWGYPKCPSTHPYVVPTFTLGAWYSTDDNLDRSGDWSPSKPTWQLSSDTMAGMTPKRPGSTMHADWFGAWDDGIMKTWSENCINKLLNCSGGDLGNGKQLKMRSDFSWNAIPRLVDSKS